MRYPTKFIFLLAFVDALLWTWTICDDCGQVKRLHNGSPRRGYCIDCCQPLRDDRSFHDDPQYNELESFREASLAEMHEAMV